MSYFPKLTQLSTLTTIITGGAILVAISNNALANSTSDSSYADSCQNIQVVGATLSARCSRKNGSSKVTSILIRGIENRNGDFTYFSNSTDASNYQSSCRSIRVNRTTLSARCMQINGDSKRTSIPIRGIENQDGNLTYSR